jgi:glycerol kinase
MTKTHILALDQGTSSSRSIVFDARGRIKAMAQREFRQIFPQPGWVEHDPKEIWTSQLATAHEAIAKAGLRADEIASIGITNQRETTLVWNRATGEPVYNAIVWQDRRAEPTCAALRERGLEPLFREKTGLIIDAYFSGTKLKWILDHERLGRTRRAGVRHGRCVADVATDERRRARDRCQQRGAHAAVQRAPQRVGR